MMEREMPIFVKLEEYKDILDIIALIKTKIGDARVIMSKINEVKNEEDNELQLWKSEMEEVERIVDMIDKRLFEPENL